MLNATAKDVAREVGVDPSTVSRVLNRPSARHHYAPATVRSIRKAAHRLGYRPSRTAQALRTGKTFNLGLVVADIGNPFWAELAARVERHARDQHYRLLVCSTDESPVRQKELLADLTQHGVDGLIVAPCGPEGLRDIRVPLVTVDRHVPNLPVSHVGLDDAKAGRLLGRHLHELGYRKVGVVMPSAKHDPSILTRAQGLAESVQVLWRALPLAAEIRIRLESMPLPHAVVGLNNTSTLAALEVLPPGVGLAGIDDFSAARFLKPAVTVVAQPVEEIAGEAVRILLGTDRKPVLRLVQPSLIQRESLPKRNS